MIVQYDLVDIHAIQILLQLTTAVSVHLSLSPPNPPVKTAECCSGTEGTETLFERFVQSVTYFSKCLCWIGVLCNTFHFVTHHLLCSFTENGWAIGKSATSEYHHVHWAIVVGTIAAIAGATLRNWCFRTLGQLFTFEITIRPKHELVTHGPYAWVRHPSYTGVYLTLGGATLVLGSPQTWISGHFIRTPIGAFLAGFWLLKCAFAFHGMCVRLRAEDEVLKKTFGPEWEDYANQVPYKFIPGVV